MMAERVLALNEAAKMDLPVSRGKPLAGQALQEWLVKKEDQAATSAIERGIGYALLKRELGHGAFEGWLKDNGINLRSAQQYMKSARLLMSMSEPNARRASLLPQRKLNVLAGAPAPMVEELFGDGSLDNIEELSREQLREIVQLRKQIDSQAARQQRLEKRVSAQDEELARLRSLPEEDVKLTELRRAVLEETEALRINAHQLQAFMNIAQGLPELAPANRDAVVHPLMYSLQGLYATVATLYNTAYQTFEGYYPDTGVLPPQLDETEAARAQALADTFRTEAEIRAANRQADLALKPTRSRRVAKKGAK